MLITRETDYALRMLRVLLDEVFAEFLDLMDEINEEEEKE